jgi:hypothetical protein
MLSDALVHAWQEIERSDSNRARCIGETPTESEVRAIAELVAWFNDWVVDVVSLGVGSGHSVLGSEALLSRVRRGGWDDGGGHG